MVDSTVLTLSMSVRKVITAQVTHLFPILDLVRSDTFSTNQRAAVVFPVLEDITVIKKE